MASNIGYVKIRTKQIQVEWEIPDFLSVMKDDKDRVESERFSFANVVWNLGLVPFSALHPGFITLYIETNKCPEYLVQYNFGIKKVDGSLEKLVADYFSSFKLWTLQRSEMQERHSELAPSGIVTVICTLKQEITQPSVLDKPKLKALLRLDTLSQNFKDLFENKDSCDTTLYVQDKEYKAHKTVLIARSKVFAGMLLHETSEKQTGIITIPDCDPQSFEEFLEFLYCGKLEEISFSSALHLYETSDKYDIQELKEFCSEYLMENFTAQNICDVMLLADKFDDVKLISTAQNFFSKNLSEILQTSEWDCLLKNNYRLGNKFLKGMPKMKVAEEAE